MRPYTLYKTQCYFSAELFVLTCRKGYDSRKFIDTFLRSDWGDIYYNDFEAWLWLGHTYVLSELEEYFEFENGPTLPEDFMYWFGYLLRFWTFNYTDSISDILDMHSIDDWLNSYIGLHVMDWVGVIQHMRISDKPLEERPDF